MTKRFTFILILSLIITVCYSWKVQLTNNKDCLFTDNYGNVFTLKNANNFQKYLDTAFLKSNLTGLYFNNKTTQDTLRFHYTITNLKKIKKGFEIHVEQTPIAKDIKNILFNQGCSHYLLSVKNVNGKLKIDRIQFLSAEI